MNGVLLDTCAILRLASGEGELSNAALDAIAKASMAYVSPISLWEIALKVKSGNLVIPGDPETFFTDAVEHYDLTVLPLSLDVMAKAVNLPEIHRDPADRFIIASALMNGLSVVTTDRRFHEYGVNVIA